MKTFFAIQLLTLFTFIACLPGDGLLGQVVVTLKDSEVSTSNPKVLIRNVARITGGPSAIAERIGDLDIDSLDAASTTSRVSQEQVAIRIAIDGINHRDYVVRGAGSVQTRLIEHRQISQGLEAKLTNALATHYSIPADRIEVTLQPGSNQSEMTGLSDYELASTMPLELPLGATRLPLRSYRQGSNSRTKYISVVIAIHRDMTVASRDISKGQVIAAQDVTLVRRPVASKRVAFLTLEQAIGKTARMNISSFSLIKPTDVQTVSQFEKLVKRNTVVSAVFTHGNLEVTLRGARTKSAGNKGDLVKFSNPNNGAILEGIVVDSRTLKVN